MPEKKKNQLHQLLSVEPDLRTKATKILQETIATFSKKSDHFDGFSRVYEPLQEEEGVVTKRFAPELKHVVTTVTEKINYTVKSIVSAIDAQISKEETNASGGAKAELTVGMIDFGEWSAQALLALESQLIKIRAIYVAIPTLDPAKRWELDPNSNDIYTTPENEVYKTEKRAKVITLAPPTKEHPAQTQLINIDQQVGVIKVVHNSGRITPKLKSEYLGRVDKLIIAVKKARSQANQVEVVNKKIGRKLFDYINNG